MKLIRRTPNYACDLLAFYTQELRHTAGQDRGQWTWTATTVVYCDTLLSWSIQSRRLCWTKSLTFWQYTLTNW